MYDVFVMIFQCHDVFTNQYCPRGPFCAFAHTDAEMQINRNLPLEANLADILSNVLPSGSSTSLSSTSILPKSESNNNNNNLDSSISNTSLNMNNNIGNGSASASNSTIDIFSGMSISVGKNPSVGGGSISSEYSLPESGRRIESPPSEYSNAFGGLINNTTSAPGLGSSTFGTQSFASAVTASYSSAAAGGLNSGNNGGLNNKLYGDDGKKDIGCGDSLDMLNGSITKSSNLGPSLIMGSSLMDSLSVDPVDGYRLFASAPISSKFSVPIKSLHLQIPDPDVISHFVITVTLIYFCFGCRTN